MTIKSLKPRISVIIPAYNADNFIAEALDSVFAQSLRPMEIIIVDDGSSDGTEQVVRSYQFAEERVNTYRTRIERLSPNDASEMPGEGHIEIILKRQVNRGPAAARNEGIQLARGEFIAFLDADDLWFPHCLETLANSLVNEHDAVLAFADGVNFDESSDTLRTAFSQQNDILTGRINEPFPHFILCNRILTGAVLLRRYYLEAVEGFDESITYGEDQELWLRLALTGPFICDPSLVLLRRRHRRSLSHENEGLFYESGIQFLESLGERYGDRIANLGVDMVKVLRLAHRHLAYWYYTQGQYVQSLRSLWKMRSRILSKSRMKSDNSQDQNRQFEKHGQVK